jgi:hypothetical protein
VSSTSNETLAGKTSGIGESITPQDSPTFGKALRFWVKLGFISFGGPTGQIAVMQTGGRRCGRPRLFILYIAAGEGACSTY